MERRTKPIVLQRFSFDSAVVPGLACLAVHKEYEDWTAPPEIQDLPATLTIRQAANVARVSEHTIRRRVSDRTLRAYRPGPRLIRIDRDSLINFTRSTVIGA